MTSQNRFNSPRKPVDYLFSPVEDQIQTVRAQVLFNSGNELASKVGMNSIIQIKGEKRKKNKILSLSHTCIPTWPGGYLVQRERVKSHLFLFIK